MSEASSPEIRPLIRVSKLPILKRIVESFDQSAEKIGLHETAANFLARLKCRVNISYESPETIEILRDKPTIVIATHNKGKTEGLPLVASLPPRDDLYILGSAGYMTWGNSFRKFLLPMYISNKSTGGLVAKFLTKTEFESANAGSKENFDKNLASLEEGARKLDEGHQLIIFPDGNRVGKKQRKGIWHYGIGYLLSKLPKSSNTYIVMAKVGNPHLQITKGSLFGIDVKFSEPIRISDLLNQPELSSPSPRLITGILEAKYYGFK